MIKKLYKHFLIMKSFKEEYIDRWKLFDRDRNYSQIYLGTLSTSERAIHLYKSARFILTSRYDIMIIKLQIYLW